MTQLYSILAEIYHEMYLRIFDYEREFRFYQEIMNPLGTRSVLEIGCGSGILARKFLEAGYDYSGLDKYEEMLNIARRLSPEGDFVCHDMRQFSFDRKFDAVLITGRSLAYVVDNKGITDTFRNVAACLDKQGIFIFEVFDASAIFENFGDFEQTIHSGDKVIRRKSSMNLNLETGFTYDWSANYEVVAGGKTENYHDLTTLRAFTRDEIALLLSLGGFSVIKSIEENKSFSIIAQKTKKKS